MATPTGPYVQVSPASGSPLVNEVGKIVEPLAAGDGVDSNTKGFGTTFPYVGLPSGAGVNTAGSYEPHRPHAAQARRPSTGGPAPPLPIPGAHRDPNRSRDDHPPTPPRDRACPSPSQARRPAGRAPAAVAAAPCSSDAAAAGPADARPPRRAW